MTPGLPDSLWAQTAPPGPDCPPLEGPAETGVAIVGGGFTGLSAALHLAESGIAATVLEAAEPGWGASGRNGGQVNPGLKVLPDEIVDRHGVDRGGRINRMADATCDLVFELIERHRIDCEAIRPGYVQGAFALRGLESIANWARQWGALGAPVEVLDRRETADLLGTSLYHGAFHDLRGGSVQPLAYARGLARAALAAGATVHGGSPVVEVNRQGAGWRLTTPRGRLDARQLLLCTNGYTDGLWPGLAQCVVPVASFMAATPPLGDNLLKTVLPGRHAVSETRHVAYYFRVDAAGRFLMGGRGPVGRSEPRDAADLEHVTATAVELFPQLEGQDWPISWGGYVAMTWDHAPKLMRLGEGAYAGMGFNGRGVAMATMMGRQLAMAARGEDPDLVVEPLSPIPLHAFRDLGVAGRVLLGRWLDRFEQRRPPGAAA